MPIISQSSLVNCRPRDLFRYFSKPSNLQSSSPMIPSITFHSVGPLLGKGQVIKFDLSYSMFCITWTSRVTKFQPFEYFEDTQLDGPFRHWVHRHTFEESGEKTLVHDEIEYEVGLGILGQIMDKLVIRYQVDRMLRNRVDRATEKFAVVKHSAA